MKLIKEQFEVFALEQGYDNGAELYEDVGLKRVTYERYESEVPVSKQTLKTLCWELGAANVLDFILFESNEKSRYKHILEEF